MKAVIDQGFFR